MKSKKFLRIDITYKKISEKVLLSNIEKIPEVISTKTMIRTCMSCGDESVAGLCAVHEEQYLRKAEI